MPIRQANLQLTINRFAVQLIQLHNELKRIEIRKDDIEKKISANYEIIGRLYVAGLEENRDEMEMWKDEIINFDNQLQNLNEDLEEKSSHIEAMHRQLNELESRLEI